MSEHQPLAQLLAPSSIRLDATADGIDDAVRQAGEALVDAGAVTSAYVDAMLERERSVSTYVGEGVAVPHATLSGKQDVRENALVLLRFPEGVDWNGDDVRVVIGLAAVGRGHIGLLSRLATILLDPAAAAALRDAATAEQVYAVLRDPAADSASLPTR